jgi:hypothetical protein
MTRIYGGSTNQDETFDSQTLIDVGLFDAGQDASIRGPFIAYLTRGSGIIDGAAVSDGDLIRGEDLAFQATVDAQLIVVHTTQSAL